jgi:hypothetical protein
MATMHRRQLDTTGTPLPDKRFTKQASACRKLESKRFAELSRVLKTIMREIQTAQAGDACTIDFVGTLVRLSYGYRPAYSVCGSSADWRVVTRDSLLLTALGTDTGERYTDAQIVAIVASGCGRRELFDPANVPTLKARKTRSDKGNSHQSHIRPEAFKAARGKFSTE